MTRMIDESLFTSAEGEIALFGSRCSDCGAHTFPRQGGCPSCTGAAMEEVPLSRVGTLWSFTVQAFEPKPPFTGPAEFVPYGVGYVELPGQLIVEARLTVNSPDELRIGMPMRLELVPFRDDDVLTFAFAPEVAA